MVNVVNNILGNKTLQISGHKNSAAYIQKGITAASGKIIKKESGYDTYGEPITIFHIIGDKNKLDNIVPKYVPKQYEQYYSGVYW